MHIFESFLVFLDLVRLVLRLDFVFVTSITLSFVFLIPLKRSWERDIDNRDLISVVVSQTVSSRQSLNCTRCGVQIGAKIHGKCYPEVDDAKLPNSS